MCETKEWHDVTLLPDDTYGIVPYNECDYPIQLSSELEYYNWGGLKHPNHNEHPERDSLDGH